MLDHAREAVSLVARKERGDLDTDRVLQLALVRLIEIVGEAARQVSDETQTRHPQIPWPQVISTRNRLVHGYDFVDHDILWETITDDLPALIAQLEQIIQ
jgi:uncharacterized protein with HEPN domain